MEDGAMFRSYCFVLEKGMVSPMEAAIGLKTQITQSSKRSEPFRIFIIRNDLVHVGLDALQATGLFII